MSKENCTTIRRELDEWTLGNQYNADILAHLNECSECREFDEKQTKLRQIVGSLGTVAAPPDFDFRLRSRLASDNARSAFHFNAQGLLGQRSAAVAASLVLLIAAIVGIRYVTNQSKDKGDVAKGTGVDQVKPIVLPKPIPAESTAPGDKSIEPQHRETVATVTTPANRKPTSNPTRVKRALATADSAFERAPVIGSAQPSHDTVIPIDASQQSLKVSLFDGRGNPRTISLPSVTFGSQRVVPTTTSFAPKGVW